MDHVSTNFMIPIKKTDDDRQLAYGEVYVPMIPDSQGDFMTEIEIEKMAHRFMKNQLMYDVDTEHDMADNGAVVVESFIARVGDPDFMKGAWVAAIWVPDDLWPLVKSGELGGFSMYGGGERIPTMITIEVPDDGIMKGETGEMEDHTHKFTLRFDSEGSFLGGETNTVNGHSHEITKGTVTDKNAGHRHRFSFVEALQA